MSDNRNPLTVPIESLELVQDPRFSLAHPDVNSWVPVWEELVAKHGADQAEQFWTIACELADEYGI